MILEREFQNAAIHEAGHIVAALHTGSACAYGWLYVQEAAGSIGFGGKVYAECQGKLCRAVMGFAGVAAEIISDIPSIGAAGVTEFIKYGIKEPSENDWEYISSVNPSWRGRALSLCLQILKANWDQVDIVAAELALALNATSSREKMPFFTLEIIEGIKSRMVVVR